MACLARFVALSCSLQSVFPARCIFRGITWAALFRRDPLYRKVKDSLLFDLQVQFLYGESHVGSRVENFTSESIITNV